MTVILLFENVVNLTCFAWWKKYCSV